MINGVPFLDGGCAEKIPYSWAKENGEKKVVVVRTRDLTFRRPLKPSKLARRVYHKYPAFVESLENANENYNQTADELAKAMAYTGCTDLGKMDPSVIHRI